tara:strand:- start:18621 stop:18791 length:171 start_codon:yes stop_codon:yes gene_type:complete
MANFKFGPQELSFLIVAAKNATIQGKDAVVVANIITSLEKELQKISVPPEVAARKG